MQLRKYTKKNMDKICGYLLNVAKNTKIPITEKLTIPENKNLMLTYVNNKIVLELREASSSTLNGYALIPKKEYKLSEGDHLQIDENTTYNILYEGKRKSLDISTSKSNKKIKLAPIFGTVKQTDPINNQSVDGTWKKLRPNVIAWIPNNFIQTNKIASFDLDGTLIKTKSGKRFPIDENDWIFLFPQVSETLTKISDTYKLAIITNQKGIGNDINKLNLFKIKITNIFNKLGLKFMVFISTDADKYRKPSPGMWDLLKDVTEANINDSFYVGDAAGRPANKQLKIPKDHSLADRLFAKNVGLKFYTPSEYFLNAPKLKYDLPKFDPTKVESGVYEVELPKTPELILMVGSPASGKSTFCKKVLIPAGYVYVNRDTLGTQQHCLNAVNQALAQKKSVVVDNTNPNDTVRKPYIICAKKFDVPCRAFVMNIDSDQARHNNKFRQFTDNSHQKVNDIIIYSYFKNFVAPEKSEGIEDIIKIDFKLNFTNSALEDYYRKFFLEK